MTTDMLVATMLGEKIKVELSRHCMKRVKERTDYTTTSVLYGIVALLEREDVAEYILLEVPIGEEIVILDKSMSYSFVIVIGTNEIIVKTLFCNSKNSNPYVGAQQPCIVITDVMTLVKGHMLLNVA